VGSRLQEANLVWMPIGTANQELARLRDQGPNPVELSTARALLCWPFARFSLRPVGVPLASCFDSTLSFDLRGTLWITSQKTSLP